MFDVDNNEHLRNRICQENILRRLTAAVIIAGLPVTYTVIEANEAGAEIDCPAGRSPGWVDSSTAEGEPIRVYGCVRDSTPVITTPPTTARPPEQPSPTTAKTDAPTKAAPKSNTAPSPTAKPKSAPEATAAPPTTENPDKDGNGADDRIDFVRTAIVSQAAAAEAAQGYTVFNTGSVTDADVLNILAGNTNVADVLAKYQNPAPTTVPTTEAAAITTPTTEAQVLVAAEDGSDVLIASPPVEQTTEKLTPKEEKSNTDKKAKFALIGFGVLMLAGFAYRIRNGNSKEILYKTPGIQ